MFPPKHQNECFENDETDYATNSKPGPIATGPVYFNPIGSNRMV